MEVFIEGQSFEYTQGYSNEKLGFSLDPITFKDPTIEDKDGAFIWVDPKGRTNVFQVINPSSVFTDKAAGGKGTIVIQRPGLEPEAHDVEVVEMNGSVADSETLNYEPQTFFAYVADYEQGLGIYGTNTPKYDSTHEKELDLEDPAVSPAFRELMLKVIARNANPIS